jgi:3-hydroxybutyrate dehydrogenase
MLKGKIALVTGSTSGIGLGIAKQLAAQGVHLVLNGFGDVDGARAQVLQAGSEHGTRVGYHGADMGKSADIESMMRYAEADFGRVDILVNNAGIQHVSPIESFPIDKWDAILAINLSSAFHTTRLAMNGMRMRNWGRIINVASVHGMVGSSGKSAYIAAKHGLIGLTKAVALETATTGITCNAICPGWVLTPLVENQIKARSAKEGISLQQAQAELLGEKQPSLQFVTPEQLGDMAVFLCSPSASNVRGVAWNMDGGWIAQ